MGFKIKNYKKPKNNLNPYQWNKIINNKDTILIDARNLLNLILAVLKIIKPKCRKFRQFLSISKNSKKMTVLQCFAQEALDVKKLIFI